MAGSVDVCVVMPVYNAARYVSAAVESVLAQECVAFELIAVNDGSTDGSKAVLDVHASRDSRVKVLDFPNSGIAQSLNCAIANARGKYVARMDADDVCLPGRLQSQVNFLDANSDCVAVGTGVEFMDEDGEFLSRQEPSALTHEAIEALHFAGRGAAISHPTAMVRRDALDRVGGYRLLQHCEDLDLWLRLGELGRLANIPDVLLKYRLHPSSVSAARLDQRRDLMLQVIREAWQRRGLPEYGLEVRSAKALTELDHASRCAWLAIGTGRLGVARKHAIRAMRIAPFSVAAWRLCGSVVRRSIARNA